MKQVITQNPYSLFIAILRSELKEEVVTEYKFHPQRKFRFDIAIPKWKVAIEVEGGVYTSSVAHSSVTGILRDMEKYNLATEEEWRVLRYTPEQTKKSATLEQIKKVVLITKVNERTWKL